MARRLFKALTAAGLLAWTRLDWRYHILLLLVFAFRGDPDGGHKKRTAPIDPPHKLTAESSERSVRRAVPIGTTLEDAREIMEKRNFTCKLGRNKHGGQHLVCKIWESTGFLTSYVRRATFDIQDGRVSKVWFAEGGLGP